MKWEEEALWSNGTVTQQGLLYYGSASVYQALLNDCFNAFTLALAMGHKPWTWPISDALIDYSAITFKLNIEIDVGLYLAVQC